MCVLHQQEGVQPRSLVKQHPGALGEASACSAATPACPLVSVLVPHLFVQLPTPAPALSTPPPIFPSPFCSPLTLNRGEYFLEK